MFSRLHAFHYQDPHERIRRALNMTSRPDEVDVTFGVNVSTMAGVFSVSASAGANVGVTVRWTGKAEETTH